MMKPCSMDLIVDTCESFYCVWELLPSDLKWVGDYTTIIQAICNVKLEGNIYILSNDNSAVQLIFLKSFKFITLIKTRNMTDETNILLTWNQ